MKDKCLNCGKDVEIEKINIDELGKHATCPDCGSSFDVDIEIEKERGITISNLKKIGVTGHFGLHNLPIIGAPSTGKSAFMAEQMLSRAKEQGFVVVNYQREQDFEKQRLNKKFSEYLFGNDLYLGMVSMYGRKPKLIPDYLVEYKIDTFAKLSAEHELIKDKKSLHSSKIRAMIEKAYEIVTKPE